MSLEEDNTPSPAEIKKALPQQNPEIDNVVTLPERQELIDRVGLATVEHALRGTPLNPDGTINTDAVAEQLSSSVGIPKDVLKAALARQSFGGGAS